MDRSLARTIPHPRFPTHVAEAAISQQTCMARIVPHHQVCTHDGALCLCASHISCVSALRRVAAIAIPSSSPSTRLPLPLDPTSALQVWLPLLSAPVFLKECFTSRARLRPLQSFFLPLWQVTSKSGKQMRGGSRHKLVSLELRSLSVVSMALICYRVVSLRRHTGQVRVAALAHKK